MPPIPTIERDLQNVEQSPYTRFNTIEAVRRMMLHALEKNADGLKNSMFGMIIVPPPPQDTGTMVLLLTGNAHEIAQKAVETRRSGRYTGVPEGSVLAGVFGLYGFVEFNAGFGAFSEDGYSSRSGPGYAYASVMFPDYGLVSFWMERSGEVPMVASTHPLPIEAVHLTPEMVDVDSVTAALKKYGKDEYVEDVAKQDEEIGQSALSRIMTALKSPDEMLDIIAE